MYFKSKFAFLETKRTSTRLVQDALRDKVVAELCMLEQENNIRKVDHIDWSAPIEVVLKSNKTVRICGYIKVNTNPNVELEHYPLRSVEDLRVTSRW